jgi:glycine oxidase
VEPATGKAVRHGSMRAVFRWGDGRVGQTDVVVIGAGVVGLAAARALAGRGARVQVVDSRGVGAEASSAAAGMLAPQAETHEGSPLLALALLARDRHLALAPELEGETGIAVGLSRTGLLEIALTDDDERALAARAAWQRAAGLPLQTLTADEVRALEPNVAAAVRCGVSLEGDRRLDNRLLVRALAASAASRGVRIVTGRPVAAILSSASRVTGVRVGSGTIDAPVVVNAAGAWAGELPGDPSPPPVEPVRGQLVAFDASPPRFGRVVASPRGYLVPRADGRLIAGSTAERVGFDKSVTAAGLRTVLGIALELAPSLADARVAETWAGLRPGTPDGLPVIGAGALEGLWHAAGLYRNGILLGPLVGELVAALCSGETPSPDLGAFAPQRFEAALRA